MTVRAKFLCSSVEMSRPGPFEVQRYTGTGDPPTTRLAWPRTYKFMAAYDPDVPEDQRYAEATPNGQLSINIDNPAVSFEPGRYYYLDFTPVKG